MGQISLAMTDNNQTFSHPQGGVGNCGDFDTSTPCRKLSRRELALCPLVSTKGIPLSQETFARPKCSRPNVDNRTTYLI